MLQFLKRINMNKITSILLLILTLWACQDIDPLKPPDELSMNYGQLIIDTLYVTADSFVVNDRVNTFNARKLCIGSYKNFEAAILLKFIDIPDSGSIIDSVAIEFSTLHVFGEAYVNMPVSLYKVDEQWYENANTEDQWHSYNPTSEIQAFQITTEDSSRIKFTISDTTLINEWISDGIYNKGLFLKCTDPGINYIREIASSEYGVDSLAPMITFRYKGINDTVFVTDTMDVQYTLDATIFDNNGNEIFDYAKSQNDILVASGIAARTYIQFNEISLLPQNIIIQKAEIFLPIWDEDFVIQGQKNSFNNKNDIQDYYINYITDFASAELDSIYLNIISLTENDSVLTMESNSDRARMGKYFIQSIVNESLQSEWFSIQYQNEGQDLSIKRFMRTADNPGRLILKYFKVEQSGF